MIMGTPRFRIGVGGHQELGNRETSRFVAEQFRQLLMTYQQHQEIVLYAALARGADQLFVQAALDLGVPVEAVLPCAEYESLFPSGKALTEYRRLLHTCRVTHQLPIQTCSNEAFLAAGQWIIDQSDLSILALNGLPPRGRGGTGDMASYARSLGRPFVHLHTRDHTVTVYGNLSQQEQKTLSIAPKRTFAVSKQQMYQGPVLTINQYKLHKPGGKELIRDVVERPESVLVLPLSPGEHDTMVLLVEEYDLGAEAWQLTLPGGKMEPGQTDGGYEQVQKELRQEIGYRAGKIEKLISFYSHPGYVSHKVHLFMAQ